MQVWNIVVYTCGIIAVLCAMFYHLREEMYTYFNAWRSLCNYIKLAFYRYNGVNRGYDYLAREYTTFGVII